MFKASNKRCPKGTLEHLGTPGGILMLSIIFSFLFLNVGVAASQSRDFELSDRFLNAYVSIHGQIMSDEDVYKIYFYKMVNSFELNNGPTALKYANLILDGAAFGGPGDRLPLRYLDLAKIVKGEVEAWEDPSKEGSEEKNLKDLEDISREMKKARDRLITGKAGEGTQKIQKDIEDRLKQMIDKEEASQKAAQEADAQRAAAEIERLKKRAEGNFPDLQPQNPAKEAMPDGSTAPGAVDQKKVKEITAVWGTLPEKERARALVEVTRGLPKADRAVVEKYFKELQKHK